ncbi:MAG TPA: TlyA family RNA methyltransferase [Candidatus Saccharimonadales bacterium]|jgi:23S rRNA (cytidine1920-2'-O)/16S rRNA (cytidine1409-2'-O)-methyltransferase
MTKQRLDVAMAARGLVSSRSQAESYVRLGQVMVNGRAAAKAGQMVNEADAITLTATEQYVGRAALKLKSAAETFGLDFAGKTVLDVGSSTGGFTQYALEHGAVKVIAVDVGTDQLHPSLRGDQRIELHEKTDIRDFITPERIDMVVGDVSFISLREILPHVATLVDGRSDIVAMVKPQFEAGQSSLKHKGVIKNDKMRREILKDFETWAQRHFKIVQKTDSEVPGSRGNVERFYLLKKLA